ncbi:hypothetical protein DBV15_12172, partial [Temnothorax longispinosus]
MRYEEISMLNARLYCPPNFVNSMDEENGEWHYFLSSIGEAQAPWQYNYVFRGININLPEVKLEVELSRSILNCQHLQALAPYYSRSIEMLGLCYCEIIARGYCEINNIKSVKDAVKDCRTIYNKEDL